MKKSEKSRIINQGVEFLKLSEEKFLQKERKNIDKLSHLESSMMAMIYISLITKKFIEDLESYEDIGEDVKHDLNEMIKIIKNFKKEIDRVEYGIIEIEQNLVKDRPLAYRSYYAR